MKEWKQKGLLVEHEGQKANNAEGQKANNAAETISAAKTNSAAKIAKKPAGATAAAAAAKAKPKAKMLPRKAADIFRGPPQSSGVEVAGAFLNGIYERVYPAEIADLSPLFCEQR